MHFVFHYILTSLISTGSPSPFNWIPFSKAISLIILDLLSRLGCLVDSFCIICVWYQKINVFFSFCLVSVSKWKISRNPCIHSVFSFRYFTIGFTLQLLRRSTAAEANSLPNFTANFRRISCSSGNSPLLEAAKMRLEIASINSSGHSLCRENSLD